MQYNNLNAKQMIIKSKLLLTKSYYFQFLAKKKSGKYERLAELAISDQCGFLLQ